MRRDVRATHTSWPHLFTESRTHVCCKYLTISDLGAGEEAPICRICSFLCVDTPRLADCTWSWEETYTVSSPAIPGEGAGREQGPQRTHFPTGEAKAGLRPYQAFASLHTDPAGDLPD